MATSTSFWYSSTTIRCIITDDSGNWWNTSTNSFEAYNLSNIALYGIATTAVASIGSYSLYGLTYPSSLPTGHYNVGYVVSTGSSLQVSDFPPVANQSVQWDGTSDISNATDYLSTAEKTQLSTAATSLQASSYAAPPTTAENAAAVAGAILVTSANKLNTDSAGKVAVNNLPTDYLSTTEQGQLATAATTASSAGWIGPYSVTVPVRDSSGNPLQNASVTLTDGNGVTKPPSFTASNGNAVFNVVTGTYTPAVILSGYSISVAPAAQSVSSTVTLDTVTMTKTAVPVTPGANQATGTTYTKDGGGNISGGIMYSFNMISPFTSIEPTGIGFSASSITAISDETTAYLSVALEVGATYIMNAGRSSTTFTVPSQPGTVFNLPDIFTT